MTPQCAASVTGATEAEAYVDKTGSGGRAWVSLRFRTSARRTRGAPVRNRSENRDP